MENTSYVKYLNHPKRSKYNADSKVVLQQTLQASMWNSCLTFLKDEPKPVRRPLQCYGEKSNLKAEVKFDVPSNDPSTPAPCNCLYRNQNCSQHKSRSCNARKGFIKTKANNSVSQHKRLSYIRLQNGHLKRFELLQNDVQIGKNLWLKRRYAAMNRFFPYNNKKHSRLSLNASCRQACFGSATHHSNAFTPKFKPHASIQSSSFSKSQSICFLQPEAFCSCIKSPMPSNGLAISHHANQSYSIRRLLASFLVSMSSKKNSSFQVPVPLSSKKSIESLCEILLDSARSNIPRLPIDKSTSATNQSCRYTFHHKEKEFDAYKQVDAETSLSVELLCNTCLLSYVDEQLFKNKTDHVTLPNGKAKDEHSGVVSKFPPCCYATCVNGSVSGKDLTTNNVHLAEKRISSRLKQKRGTGLQSPYGEDYVLDIPASKKYKKPKLSHPYSHKLFWNYYEKCKSAEKHKWTSLAHIYYKISSVQDHCDSIKEPHQFADQKSKLMLHNGSIESNNSPRSDCTSCCPYCGISFKGYLEKQRSNHMKRHCQSQWTTFHAPQFFPRNWQTRFRPKEEPTVKTLRVKRPPAKSLKEKARNIANNALIRKRPTARKSYGAW